MPSAIGFYTWAAVAWHGGAAGGQSSSLVNMCSSEQDDSITLDISRPLQPRRHWSDYVAGVLQQLVAAGVKLGGMDIFVHGEVPLGAGLSSSAALEVATAFAVLALHGMRMERREIALLCQRAENQFVGTQSGIMDHFISCHAQAGHAMMLDCRSLAFSMEPVPESVRLVVCNSMVKHELAHGEYNRRRSECDEGVRLLQAKFPEASSLRDVSPQQLEENRGLLPEVIHRRLRHVVYENARVQSAADALRAGDVKRFGALMHQSHASLRDDYKVSCDELDRLVEIAADLPGVHGARMTGGGFGGCTVNLVAAESVTDVVRTIASRYKASTGVRPEVYVCAPAAGAS